MSYGSDGFARTSHAVISQKTPKTYPAVSIVLLLIDGMKSFYFLWPPLVGDSRISN